MKHALHLIAAGALCALSGAASAQLTTAGTWTGHVGLSVDGVGSNNPAVGDVQAVVPIGATILKAYLYSAGMSQRQSRSSPTSLADYNTSGITLNGTSINFFDTLVGATSPRADVGRWFTGRADVTALVQSWTTGAATTNFSWAVQEGRLNDTIDGEVLAIVYSDPSKPLGSVALLNGGQNTGGETSNVNFGSPISDPNAASFVAELGLGISFSCCNQKSTVKINGSLLTSNAGNLDDGASTTNGSLITVGGLGDTPSNGQSYANDHELYDLKPFLSTGDTSFSIFTQNPTNDDNIFFASLYITADIKDVTPNVPEPETYALMLAGLGVVAAVARRRKAR